MRKRMLWGSVLVLVAAAGIAFAVPAARYPMLAFLRNERLCNGRPVSYWIGGLKDEDAGVRRRAALSLGDADLCDEDAPEQADCRAAIQALVNGLGDTDAFVRKCAATSMLILPRDLAAPDDRASVAHLLKALGDDEVVVRQAAARGLWQAGKGIQDAGAVGPLTDALADKDDFVRAYACRALARIGPGAGSAAPALIAHVRTDEERDVRKLAAKSLGLIGAHAIGDRLPDAVDALTTAALKGETVGLREYAIRALGQLGDRKAIPALRQAARDPDEEVRDTAQEALKVLEGESP